MEDCQFSYIKKFRNKNFLEKKRKSSTLKVKPDYEKIMIWFRFSNEFETKPGVPFH
jgi:hypothetical protein